MSLSQLIKQRRLTLRLKQVQVAAVMGVEPETIGHWERGRRRIELNRLPALAVILELDPQDFCRQALAEWHPRLHATLFGAESLKSPEDSNQEDGSSRDPVLFNIAESRQLEPGIIISHSLGEGKELSQ